MKLPVCLILLTLGFSVFSQAQSCRFDSKDYDSAGFGIPQRKGMNIVGRFGCVYSCECNTKKSKVTSVLEEKHFDLNFGATSETGGPGRARWFICPHSIKPESWRPFYNEIGQTIAYQVEMDESWFEPEASSIHALKDWAKTCSAQ